MCDSEETNKANSSNSIITPITGPLLISVKTCHTASLTVIYDHYFCQVVVFNLVCFDALNFGKVAAYLIACCERVGENV